MPGTEWATTPPYIIHSKWPAVYTLRTTSLEMGENTRPTYNDDQITAYLDRIKLPEKERKYEVAELTPEEQLHFLAQLQKHQLAEIPFENLTLHYSFHRQISIDPEELFKKVVSDNNGRGGHCMENNFLFDTLLRSLGFRIYSAGARVFDDGSWSGW